MIQNYLNPKKQSKAEVKRHVVFDIESQARYPRENINTKFLIAGVYDGRNYIEHKSARSLFKDLFFSKAYENCNIYAHYGSRYDLLFLLPYLITESEKYEIMINGNRIWIYCEDGRVICDSYAIIPVSLEKAAKAFGCKYQKTKIDFSKIELNDETRAYLKNDCLTLYEVLSCFFDRLKKLGGSLKATVASCAMDIYRSRYQKRIFQVERDFHKFERQAVFGGRTEVFKKAAKKVWYYDINSSYSTSALEKLPYAPIGYFDRESEYDLDNSLCYCEIKHPYIHIPFLPVRKGPRLLFPYGEWEGWYTGLEVSEMRRVFGRNSVIVRKQIVYYCEKTLADYAKNIYEEKKNGNSAAKWLLNALYGRFALREEREKIIINPSDEFLKVQPCEPINEKFQIWKYEVESESFISPIIFAFITARARIRLWRAMSKIGFENICYCDTDSIITSKCGAGKIEIGEGLGEWKIEGVYNKYEAISPKVYRLGDNEVVHAKGFDLSHDEIDDFFKNPISNQHRLTTAKEILRGKKLEPETINLLKKIRTDDKKREWIGNESRPFYYKENENEHEKQE